MDHSLVTGNISNIGYIVSLVFSVVLGLFLLIKSRKPSSSLFVGLIFSVSFWIFTNYMADNSSAEGSALLWSQIAIIGPVFIGPLMFEFSKTFPNNDHLFNPKELGFLLLTCTPFLIFIKSTHNIQSVTLSETGLQFTPGNLYLFLSLYLGSLLVLSVINLVRTYQKSSGLARSQISYLSLGISLTSIISIIFTLILPLFGYSNLSFLGPSSITLFIALTAYSMLRHRLFGIRWVIGGALNSAIIALFPLLTFYGVYFLFSAIWGTVLNANAVLSGFIISILFVNLLRPIQEKISSVVSGLVISPDYNPRESSEQFSNKISHELDLRKIQELLHYTLSTSVKPRTIVSIVIKENTIISVFSDQKPQKSQFDWLTTITAYVNKYQLKFPLITDEILLISKKTSFDKEFISLIEKLRSAEIASVFSIETGATSHGLIALGETKAKTALTLQDIQFIQSLITTMSVAIDRSFLYWEVQEFNRTLQQKVTDATRQLKERNKELQDLYDNLEELYQKEKDLMDIAGHEFRTPASILKNNLYLLKKRIQELLPDQSDEKINKYVQRLIEGTERQIKLVNTFLESARIDNKRFELEIEMTDLAAIVTKAVSELKHFAKEKDLELIYRQPKGKIFAEVDVIRIREVIDNLINNAIKYTKQGYIEIQLSETKEKVTFSVKDTGIGIKKEDQALLFKKFSRVENYIGGEEGSIVRPGGTGLGLYVAKTIVDAHSGTIGVESNVGQGSLFFFELPHTQPSYMKRANGPRTKIVMSPLSSSGIGATTGQKLPEGSKVTSALSDVTTVSIGKSSDTSTGQPTNSPATTLSTSASGKTPEITETQSVSMPQPTGGQSA